MQALQGIWVLLRVSQFRDSSSLSFLHKLTPLFLFGQQNIRVLLVS
jgi:hypothetical protein